MTITALIAEDEPVLAQALAMLLNRLWPTLQLLPHATDGEQAVATALSAWPDILFLDIQMPGLDGLEAAETILDTWPTHRPLPLIVFVTAYDHYAVAAFEHAAVDYVLKPVESPRLATTCERLQRQLQWRHAHADADLLSTLAALRQAHAQSTSSVSMAGMPPTAIEPLTVIQAAVGSHLQMIPIDDVLYFEAADKYVRVVTALCDQRRGDILIRTPLRELVPRLNQRHFWQVHRGVVVSVKSIERVTRDSARLRVHVRGRPETLEVSRMYAHLFKAM